MYRNGTIRVRIILREFDTFVGNKSKIYKSGEDVNCIVCFWKAKFLLKKLSTISHQ